MMPVTPEIAGRAREKCSRIRAIRRYRGVIVRTSFLEDASRPEESAEPAQATPRRYVATRGHGVQRRVVLDLCALTAAFLGEWFVSDHGIADFIPWGVFFSVLVVVQLAARHAYAPR